jgi:phosphoribosylpyrophosphate synthetase
VHLRSCVGLLRDRLLLRPDAGQLAIAWPDDGAAKRFSKHFYRGSEPVFPVIICQKRRKGGEKRVVQVAEGDAEGKVVCIVDDLVQSGNTLLECARALLSEGAVGVIAYVTHAVFPHDSYAKFLEPDCPISKFYITDTIPETAAKLHGRGPFEVLSIAPVVADLLGLDDTEAGGTQIMYDRGGLYDADIGSMHGSPLADGLTD